MVTRHTQNSGGPGHDTSILLIMLVKSGEPCRARTCDLLIKRQVGDLVPDPGHVQVLFFTDKQYALSQVFRGKRRTKAPAEKPMLSLSVV